jgi:hypothetical protein
VRWIEFIYDQILGDKRTMYIRVTSWGYWLYCDYFLWCVSCTVVVLNWFAMCGCFGNMCTYIYCVVFMYHVLLLLCLCTRCIYSRFVCTSARTTATECQLNCSIIYYFPGLRPLRTTMFLDHTQRRTTVCRSPLDEWSVRFQRPLPDNTHNRQTSMPAVEFEPTIEVGERP